MALKRFCNRCGEEIGKAERGFIRRRIHYGEITFGASLLSDDIYYDLCQDCVKSFQFWMENGKDEFD